MPSTNESHGAQVVYKAVNACLTPLSGIDGCHIITVEGIGSVKGGLHPVQARPLTAAAPCGRAGACAP